ncbi:MAG: three-Cys-motif partner protein TcmP [Labilithrix sp.]|nr:three-Cys-motif partner protein TcmP [Labilithrix sp.]MBX3217173.1 three-Cys-motif partner protein TcmP [Labilithrix sp.]
MAECRDRTTGNCTREREDHLPVQCVGEWAKEKHDFIRRYIEATGGPRKKYASKGSGGLCYVDLFAGPGRAYIAKTNEFIDGTPLIAAAAPLQPYSTLVLCDLVDENIEALRVRLARPGGAGAHFVPGDCNAMIDVIASHIPKHALSLAVVDPFGASALDFATLRRLAQFARMDLIVHFPTMGIKRNFAKPDYDKTIDRFMGTDTWRTDVREPDQVVRLIPHMKRQLVALGYAKDDEVREIEVRNDQRGVLYHLFFASKSPLGNKIWKSITKTSATGQREMF